MEEFQGSYLRAIAAASGCLVARFDIDDGVDAQFNHKSSQHTAQPDLTARLEIQLKATHAPPSVASISAKMRQDRFQYYRTASPLMPKIVVIMHLPQDQADWVIASEDFLRIHHCSYWVNLAGLPDSSAVEPSVKAPRANVFDDEALCSIMQRIGQGGQP
ncbi:protein of unknown function [Pedococcus dokdonensis]|uniref:DUF4365 domain-containing protein n=1 Tax=Pedococcus dokdonensis TaxID=443156 RepID=A0A1H0U6E7_9MICO|nr:DUF4365 domain-containing protein [Pedococcus dokdonensis]SDP61763.1 protein of unknown function [Pedococcus dokdonensis]